MRCLIPRQARRSLVKSRPMLLQLRLVTPPCSRHITSAASGPEDIAAMLAKPSWSVQSLLEPEDQRSPEASITPKQLHHLLRLSALPPPRSEEEEAKMISTLQSQLHFVRAIQNVDTTGIEPLQSIRDETEDAERENEITLESLRAEFDKEVVVGHSRRITRTPDASSTAESTDGWELLSQAPKKAGRYVVVETGKR